PPALQLCTHAIREWAVPQPVLSRCKLARLQATRDRSTVLIPTDAASQKNLGSLVEFSGAGPPYLPRPDLGQYLRPPRLKLGEICEHIRRRYQIGNNVDCLKDVARRKRQPDQNDTQAR